MEMLYCYHEMEEGLSTDLRGGERGIMFASFSIQPHSPTFYPISPPLSFSLSVSGPGYSRGEGGGELSGFCDHLLLISCCIRKIVPSRFPIRADMERPERRLSVAFLLLLSLLSVSCVSNTKTTGTSKNVE